ncbi:MAG: hypothetical protein ACKVJG_05425, partial [Candidatus Latescibacterota bacterium]
MNKLKFIALTACLALACDATIVSAQSDTNGSIAGMLEGFEAESERRRSEEGENFDEAAYDFERSIMVRRIELEQQRIALDQKFRALDQELNGFYKNRQSEDANRQREDMQNRLAEFEAEAKRRRSEEGVNFDEAAYDFERSMMERRSALDERRIALDEEFNNKRDELSNSPSGQDQNAWEELDQETQRAFGALEDESHALDKEGQEYWEGRQREDAKRQREEIENRRNEIENRLAEFEAEVERRREDEGENFDEAAYDFERSMMERRSA